MFSEKANGEFIQVSFNDIVAEESEASVSCDEVQSFQTLVLSLQGTMKDNGRILLLVSDELSRHIGGIKQA
jgi:hypothetical protein